MIRLIALGAIVAGGVGSLIAAVSGPTLEFSDGEALVSRAAELRSQGQRGLQTALARYEALAADHDPDLEPAREQMRRCIDLTAGQRDAWMSRLYWYTDLGEAKAAAAASGKPILSLRMLGRLTDEFSCANSRFFRTALYANEQVSDRLREHFVLHWQSVRPVPRVTIDFGDGRKLERTITGNSAHYVLDASGRPLDVLPGLYGPQAFDEWLARCEALAAEVVAADDDAARDALIAQYHATSRDALDAALQADLAEAAAVDGSDEVTAPSGEGVFPTAVAAGNRAPAKYVVEAPMVARLAATTRPIDELDDDAWRRIAALPRHRVGLDLRSNVLIRREHPDAAAAGGRAFGKLKIEDPILRIVRDFESSIALDAVKNEYLLHRQIHAWFAAGEALRDVDDLNERVYAELFLTPSSDPWLGLAPADAYTGLTRDGLSVPDAQTSPLGVIP